MLLRRPQFLPFVLLALACVSTARAEDTDTSDDLLAVDVHGFVSQGWLLGLRNDYLAEDEERGSFEFSEVGINFTKQLGDRLRAGLQLFARDLGPRGNYRPTVDWFYLDYRFADWLGLRAGRVKLPFGLYNEINDVDAARAFVLLPQSLYTVSNRDFLLAQTGLELYGYLDLDCLGALDYRLYGGSVWVPRDIALPGPVRLDSSNIPWIVGGRVMWETPLEGLRAGVSLQVLELDLDVTYSQQLFAPLQMAGMLPADFDGQVHAEGNPCVLWVGSLEYAAYDWLLAAEFSRWHTELQDDQPLLAPETKNTEDRMYGLVAYRVASWLQPGAYYALYFPHANDRHGRQNQQHDVALVLRFDVNEHWLVKVEGHYMEGTAQLEPNLNDGAPRDQLKHSWGVLLAKTTAYF